MSVEEKFIREMKKRIKNYEKRIKNYESSAEKMRKNKSFIGEIKFLLLIISNSILFVNLLWDTMPSKYDNIIRCKMNRYIQLAKKSNNRIRKLLTYCPIYREGEKNERV